MLTLVLAARGFAAIGVLALLVGGLPRIVQVGLAAIVGLWTALLVEPVAPSAGLLVIAARELVIGATLGVVAALPLIAAATAGRLVDRAGDARGGTYRGFFGVLAAAVFVGIDGHVMVVTAIVESHRDAPALVATAPRALDAIGTLFAVGLRLAVPWLVTAAVVELAVGVGMRVAARSGVHAPVGAAVPAALAMITAALVGTLAVAIAAAIRGAWASI